MPEHHVELVRSSRTAGACPLDADGGTVAVGDVAGQAEQVMENLRTVLHASSSRWMPSRRFAAQRAEDGPRVVQ